MGAVFITFPGNCKKALTFYQTCFGGTLKLIPFEAGLRNYAEVIVSGSLVSEKISIHGSDLGHNEGRILGNSMAIFVACNNTEDRNNLMAKLGKDNKQKFKNHKDQNLIELTDTFDVRWILAINF